MKIMSMKTSMMRLMPQLNRAEKTQAIAKSNRDESTSPYCTQLVVNPPSTGQMAPVIH